MVSSRSRDAESQRRPGHVKRWPAWMVMASMATTSAILTWDQCSEDLQHKLMEAGAREECYLFQYDLDGVPGPSHGFETLPNAPAEFLSMTSFVNLLNFTLIPAEVAVMKYAILVKFMLKVMNALIPVKIAATQNQFFPQYL